MTVSDFVLGVYDHSQGLDGRYLQRVELGEVSISVFHSPHGHREGEIEDD